MRWIKSISLALPVLALMLSTAVAASSHYPAKPLKIVVPYSAGGSSDQLARMVGEQLQKDLGQTVIIENRPGAGSMLGTSYVAEQAADGYTILLADVPFTIVPALYGKRLKYDAHHAFSPLALIGDSPMYLFVNHELPVNGPKEFIEYAQSVSDGVNIGSGGNGSLTHLMAELLMQTTSTSLMHVPYQGAAASISDLAGGQIQASFSSMPSAYAIYQTGKIKPIAVSSAQRHPETPDVPTFAEQGLDSMLIQSWWGLMVREETEKHKKEILSNAIARVLATPELQERMQRLGIYVPTDTSSDAMSMFLKQDFARWDEVVRVGGITLN